MQEDPERPKPPLPIRTSRATNLMTGPILELPWSVPNLTGSHDEVEEVRNIPDSVQKRKSSVDRKLASAFGALRNEIERSANWHIQQVQAAMSTYHKQLEESLNVDANAWASSKRAPSQSAMPSAFDETDDVPLVNSSAQNAEELPPADYHGSQRSSPLHAFSDVVPHDPSQKDNIQDMEESPKAVTPKVKRQDSAHALGMKGKKVAASPSNKKGLFSKSGLVEDSCLVRFTDSRIYEWASVALILVNSVFIGWQTAFMAQRGFEDAQAHKAQQSEVPIEFTVMSYIFNVLFTVDLVLRWSAAGMVGFWWTKEAGVTENLSWNILDVLIVLIGVLDSVIEIIAAFTGSSSGDADAVMGNFSVTRVLRIVRIVKVARVIRVMKFFQELRVMVYSIMNSLKSLVWVCLVLIILLYLFAITFTSGVTTYLDSSAKWQDPANSDLVKYFGTLDRSFVNLYMAMSGGNDWTAYYDELEKMQSMYHYLFLVFITFAIFAVVNIVTGVFVDNALQSNTTDASMIVQEELEVKKAKLAAMHDVFQNLDEDETGSFTMDEFETRLRDERVQAYFSSMKLDVGDAKALFRLLDYDQSNEITIEEFVAGCAQLQGEARSLDTKIMQFELKFLKEAVAEIFQIVRNMEVAQTGKGSPADKVR